MSWLWNMIFEKEPVRRPMTQQAIKEEIDDSKRVMQNWLVRLPIPGSTMNAKFYKTYGDDDVEPDGSYAKDERGYFRMSQLMAKVNRSVFQINPNNVEWCGPHSAFSEHEGERIGDRNKDPIRPEVFPALADAYQQVEKAFCDALYSINTFPKGLVWVQHVNGNRDARSLIRSVTDKAVFWDNDGMADWNELAKDYLISENGGAKWRKATPSWREFCWTPPVQISVEIKQ